MLTPIHCTSRFIIKKKAFVPLAAPWVGITNKGTTDRSEPSLLDIQQEEERQLMAEMRHKQQQQMNGGAMWKDAGEVVRTGVWSSATHKLKWRQDSQVLFSYDQSKLENSLLPTVVTSSMD